MMDLSQLASTGLAFAEVLEACCQATLFCFSICIVVFWMVGRRDLIKGIATSHRLFCPQAKSKGEEGILELARRVSLWRSR